MTDETVAVEPSPLKDFLAEVLADLATRTEARQTEKVYETPAVEALPDPRPPRTAAKGAARQVLSSAQAACASAPIDLRRYSALAVAVFATGQSPSATVYVEGAPEAGGPWLTEPATSSGQVITSDTLLAVQVCSRFARIRLSNISGTFIEGQGFTVVVTPYTD